MRKDRFDAPYCFWAAEQAPEGLSTPRPRSAGATASSMATRSWSRSWAAGIPAPAARAGAFSRCCLRGKRFDGVMRKHYIRDDW